MQLPGGATVDCTGISSCFNAGIVAVGSGDETNGASITVHCSGTDSCEVAVISAGASNGRVDCTGDAACSGIVLNGAPTVIYSRCLSCAAGSCAYPCNYAASAGVSVMSCQDGEENGVCVTMDDETCALGGLLN